MHLNIGLSLTGGGAREHTRPESPPVSELLIEFGYQQRLPIQSLSGVSAGAINAAYLAAGKGFSQASTDLSNLWSSLTPDQVYRTDIVSIGKIGLGWVRDFTFRAAFKTKVADDLLDATPLNVLIRKTSTSTAYNKTSTVENSSESPAPHIAMALAKPLTSYSANPHRTLGPISTTLQIRPP